MPAREPHFVLFRANARTHPGDQPELFNQRGESHVTTGHIADELNISPGNLYYHFRNKDEIIHHLFAQFETCIDIEPNPITDAASAMEDLWLYLHLMFERIWAYRFLYRNLNDLLARDASSNRTSTSSSATSARRW